METKANYTLVGLFTLAVIAAAFGFVWWFSGLGGGSDRREIRVVFTGSVTGLTRGSNVLFNGFRVGEVKDMQLSPEDPRSTFAVIDIATTTPVRADTRARIEAQGLAGVVAVQLIGGSPESPPLTPRQGQRLPTIIAERSEVQDLLETVRNVARRTDDLFERVGKLVDENDEAVARTVRNVERFSQALGDNADGVNRTLASIAGAAERVGPLAEQLETLTRNLNGMIAQVDVGSVNRTLANVEQFSQALGGNAEGVSRMLATVTSAAERIGPLAEQLERFSRDIARVGAAVDPERVGRTLENVDRFAAALAGSSGDVTKTLQSVASLTDKLNRAADQVESVLKSAQSFLGSASGGEGQGALAEVGSAARSIRALADNLDRRTAEITAGVSRFTGPGLRDIEALASDGRRTLNDINRTLRNIERNPQQLIFGGRPAIPDYQGRR